MRATRHDPIAVPLGHIERAREPFGSRETSHLHHSGRQRIPVLDERAIGTHLADCVRAGVIDHDTAVDYSALDRPTVTRRAESAPPGWLDLDREVRDEIRGIAVDQLTKRLGDARAALYKAVAREEPSMHLAERVARLERSLRMVRTWP